MNEKLIITLLVLVVGAGGMHILGILGLSAKKIKNIKHRL